MQAKRYIERLIAQCSDQVFGREAVEWGILSGHITLTYDLERDLNQIMGNSANIYDALCEAYRKECRANEEVIEMQGMMLPVLPALRPVDVELRKLEVA